MQCIVLKAYIQGPSGWSRFSSSWLEALHVDSQEASRRGATLGRCSATRAGLGLIVDGVEDGDQIERHRPCRARDVLLHELRVAVPSRFASARPAARPSAEKS